MSLRLTALLAIAASSVAGAALAQAQPFTPVEAPKTWTAQVGAGVVYGTGVTDRTESDYRAVPWASVNYRDVVYANGLDGIGWNAVKTDSFRAGLQLRPRYAADDIEGSSLERPGFGADAAIYAYQRLPGNVVIGGRVSQDVTGDEAGLEYLASVDHQRVTPVGLLRASAYVRGGNDERIQRYYGVTPEQAPGSGFSPYTFEGGLSGAGATVLLAVPVGERFGLGGFVNYEQRLGDLKDSPLIENDHVWRAGLIGVVRFSSGS